MKTATEMSKKKGIKKNIDNIVSIYDSGKNNEEKSKNLREKINNDINKMKERFLGKAAIENYDALISLLDPMRTELIDVFYKKVTIFSNILSDSECLLSQRPNKN